MSKWLPPSRTSPCGATARAGYSSRRRSVTIDVSGRIPDVTEPLDDVDIDVAIARAEVPDITVYNVYLPRDGVMRLVSGRGQVESRFHMSGDRAQGHVHVLAPSVAAVINGIELGFDVDLELELSGAAGARAGSASTAARCACTTSCTRTAGLLRTGPRSSDSSAASCTGRSRLRWMPACDST
ncbi:MAG: hypothetical protein M5U09_21850 [Gammaproteobacteria bacterium]|nr:hypothetical protein [Gammaproteobacteria bacterium]